MLGPLISPDLWSRFLPICALHVLAYLMLAVTPEELVSAPAYRRGNRLREVKSLIQHCAVSRWQSPHSESELHCDLGFVTLSPPLTCVASEPQGHLCQWDQWYSFPVVWWYGLVSKSSSLLPNGPTALSGWIFLPVILHPMHPQQL